MKSLLVKFLKYLTKDLDIDQPELRQAIECEGKKIVVETKQDLQKPIKNQQNIEKSKKKVSTSITRKISIDPRDIMESMGVPFLALSKNRKAPIIYESLDGTTKVRISCHSEHYIASIYDWDIIQCIAGKIQEIINDKKDIPPRTIIVPRHQLLKELRRCDGKKSRKEIEASLSRLKVTGIETTVRNEDFRYKGGFGFIDSWGYTERKDIKEFRITLSDWLYDGICKPGALLKFSPKYFEMTSGLKKILYRIARKQVGTQNKNWDFSIEELHIKSGSERDLRKFKHDLKKIILDNDLPDYSIKWIEEDRKTLIRFINRQKYLEQVLKSSESQITLPLN